MKQLKLLSSLLVVILLIGCGNNEYIDDYNNSTTQLQTTTSIPTDLKDVPYDEYNKMTHGATYITADISGSYYIAPTGRNRMIHFYDYNTKQDILLCNRLNCNHNDSNCSAFIEQNEKSDYFIQFYGNKLYTITQNSNGIFLDSLDKDGSNHQRLSNLYPDDIANVAGVFKGIFYKDTYYYMVTDQDKNCYYYELNISTNSKPTLMFKLNYYGASKTNTSFWVNNNGIILSGKLDQSEDYTSLLLYDKSSNKLTKLYENISNMKIICNDNIYLIADGGLYMLKDGALEQLYSSTDITYSNCQVYCNSNYIVIDKLNNDNSTYSYSNNQRYFYVFDINTKQVKKLDISSNIKTCDETAEMSDKLVTQTGVLGFSNNNFYYWQFFSHEMYKIDLYSFMNGNYNEQIIPLKLTGY